MADGSRARRPLALPLVMRSLSSASSTGSGTAFKFDGALGRHGIQVTVDSTKGCRVDLEGSLNDSNYFLLTSWTSSSGQASGNILFTVDKPVFATRATVISRSTAVTAISAWLSASQ